MGKNNKKIVETTSSTAATVTSESSTTQSATQKSTTPTFNTPGLTKPDLTRLLLKWEQALQLLEPFTAQLSQKATSTGNAEDDIILEICLQKLNTTKLGIKLLKRLLELQTQHSSAPLGAIGLAELKKIAETFYKEILKNHGEFEKFAPLYQTIEEKLNQTKLLEASSTHAGTLLNKIGKDLTQQILQVVQSDLSELANVAAEQGLINRISGGWKHYDICDFYLNDYWLGDSPLSLQDIIKNPVFTDFSSKHYDVAEDLAEEKLDALIKSVLASPVPLLVFPILFSGLCHDKAQTIKLATKYKEEIAQFLNPKTLLKLVNMRNTEAKKSVAYNKCESFLTSYYHIAYACFDLEELLKQSYHEFVTVDLTMETLIAHRKAIQKETQEILKLLEHKSKIWLSATTLYLAKTSYIFQTKSIDKLELLPPAERAPIKKAIEQRTKAELSIKLPPKIVFDDFSYLEDLVYFGLYIDDYNSFAQIIDKHSQIIFQLTPPQDSLHQAINNFIIKLNQIFKLRELTQLRVLNPTKLAEILNLLTLVPVKIQQDNKAKILSKVIANLTSLLTLNSQIKLAEYQEMQTILANYTDKLAPNHYQKLAQAINSELAPAAKKELTQLTALLNIQQFSNLAELKNLITRIHELQQISNTTAKTTVDWPKALDKVFASAKHGLEQPLQDILKHVETLANNSPLKTSLKNYLVVFQMTHKQCLALKQELLQAKGQLTPHLQKKILDLLAHFAKYPQSLKAELIELLKSIAVASLPAADKTKLEDYKTLVAKMAAEKSYLTPSWSKLADNFKTLAQQLLKGSEPAVVKSAPPVEPSATKTSPAAPIKIQRNLERLQPEETATTIAPSKAETQQNELQEFLSFATLLKAHKVSEDHVLHEGKAGTNAIKALALFNIGLAKLNKHLEGIKTEDKDLNLLRNFVTHRLWQAFLYGDKAELNRQMTTLATLLSKYATKLEAKTTSLFKTLDKYSNDASSKPMCRKAKEFAAKAIALVKQQILLIEHIETWQFEGIVEDTQRLTKALKEGIYMVLQDLGELDEVIQGLAKEFGKDSAEFISAFQNWLAITRQTRNETTHKAKGETVATPMLNEGLEDESFKTMLRIVRAQEKPAVKVSAVSSALFANSARPKAEQTESSKKSTMNLCP